MPSISVWQDNCTSPTVVLDLLLLSGLFPIGLLQCLVSLAKCGDQAWMQNSTEVWPNASLVDESDVIYMQMSEISRDVTSTKTLKYKYKYLDLKYKSRSRMRARTRPVSTVLSGQSTPHMIRSRATHHVIQSATLATFQVRSKCM